MEHVDVLIVGAGLSGIGAACHLQMECPGRSYAILEARGASGGTWDLFRYPGIRSDSDMFTLGYRFRPWLEEQGIADGASILRYIRDTAREHGVEERIRYHRRVTRAEWSSASARWTVEVERTDTGQTERLTCGFLLGCTGYYRYDEGYLPEFPGMERFGGTLVHPQHWPEQLDYAGKRVVVIGSGATAVTLVPAMAEQAAHVTMLQRSPTWIVSLPAKDPVARLLRRLLPPRAVYPIVRWKNVLMALASYQLSRRRPEAMKRILRRGLERNLPPGIDLDTHFTPTYDPWDQRLCLVPDGDLFGALADGRASIATDEIETFTETGLRLRSGAELEADVIVTATGLNLLFLGGIELVRDGEAISVPDTVNYKGVMFSGVPNLAATLGYSNASWTLKGDLAQQWVCRLLNHMQEHGYDTVVPRAPAAGEPTEAAFPLQSGYVLRSLHLLPKQGMTLPWRLHQNYIRDKRLLGRGPIACEQLAFSRAGTRTPPAVLA